jgi:hypothetical protein
LEPRKRQVEGNPKAVSNSFALLDNYYIVDLVRDMGVMIYDKDFDIVDLMKDLEVARHALEKNKGKDVKHPDEYDEAIVADQQCEVPLLEWVDEDSKERTSP